MPIIKLKVTEAQFAKWTEDASRSTVHPDLADWIIWAADIYSQIVRGRLQLAVMLEPDDISS